MKGLSPGWRRSLWKKGTTKSMPSRADGRNGTGESSLWKKNKTLFKKIKTGLDSHSLDRENVCQAFFCFIGMG
jgi:hypothetical protein